MPDSSRSVFSEPDDYQAALQRDGGFELVVTGRGGFSADLTRIRLRRVHVASGTENLARIAFISLPAHLTRIALPVRGGGSLVCGGIALRNDEIVTHGPGQRMHELTGGPSRWRTISLSMHDLLRYGRAMIGHTFDIPPGVCRWRPNRAILKRLSRLHDDATRMSKTQPRVFAGAEATRGLEQELIDGLIECMRATTIDELTGANVRRTEIMSRFEDVLRNDPDHALSVTDICGMLKVPARTLRACCAMHLGMGPHRYLHLRQLHFARSALRGADPGVTHVSGIAHRYGFGSLGQFAASYREQFGELPSDTMRRCVTG